MSTVAPQAPALPRFDIDQTEILRRHRASEPAITVDGEDRLGCLSSQTNLGDLGGVQWRLLDDSVNPHLGTRDHYGFCASSRTATRPLSPESVLNHRQNHAAQLDNQPTASCSKRSRRILLGRRLPCRAGKLGSAAPTAARLCCLRVRHTCQQVTPSRYKHQFFSQMRATSSRT